MVATKRNSLIVAAIFFNSSLDIVAKTFIIFVIILKFVFIVLNTQYQNKFLE